LLEGCCFSRHAPTAAISACACSRLTPCFTRPAT
jgi:hypothetical protein